MKKNSNEINTVKITDKGINAMLEYEKKLICRTSLAFSTIGLITLVVCILWLKN